MRMTTTLVAGLMLYGAVTAAPPAKKVWSFEDDPPGTIAKSFTNEAGEWKVVVDGTNHVLAQTAKSPDNVFNVALAADTGARDVELTVRFKAIAGKDDQGGGLVWRARDAKNYYIARYNPLEDNFRVYKVVAGRRTMFQNADILHGDGWHTLRVTMRGDHIECAYDGKASLDVRDSTFPAAGKIGLWSKADAQTYFDELTLTEL